MSKIKRLKMGNPNNFLEHLNEEQREARKIIYDEPVSILIGKPGSGKTFLACYVALEKLFNQEIKEIIITRPMVTVSNQKIGYLPGTFQEKLDPYLIGIKHNFSRLYGEAELNRMMGFTIKVLPIELMRSVTFLDAFIIVDEFQNAKPNDLYTVLTRLGTTSQLCFTGDETQTDIRRSDSGFYQLLDLRDMDWVAYYELTKNHRHPIVDQVIERWDHAS